MSVKKKERARSKHVKTFTAQLRKKRRETSGCFQCVYVPDPLRIGVAVCAVCKCQRPDQVKIAFYNKMRRQYKAALGLSSLVAPLSSESQLALAELAKEHGLESNTHLLHVTLLEGLWPAQSYREAREKVNLLTNIGNALRSDAVCCHFRVKSLNGVPIRSDRLKRLIIAQLEAESPIVNAAVQEVLDAG